MLTKQEDKRFLSVLADGLLHMNVPEGTEGAVKRDYETSDGKTGTKYELVYKDISGIISKINFYEGEYGTSLQLTITDGDEEPLVLSLSCSTNFGEDLLKKLPSIDLTKKVILKPYAFLDDKGKNKKGVTVIQDEIKIQNYFYNPETKININGYPEPKKSKKPLSKEEWKLYFGQCRVFLIDFIKEKFNLSEDF